MPKILFYRNKCIGCGICREMQPEVWRMSKKDGKAVLLQSIEKKGVHQSDISELYAQRSREVGAACAARAIKIV
jgi:ferredoxin